MAISDYWALASTEDIGDEIEEKVRKYYDYVSKSGHQKIWKRSYGEYFSGFFNSGEINSTGEVGELKKITVNHYRNLTQHILSMTTEQKVSFDARSINTDYKSLAQTMLANGLLDYYNRRKNIGKMSKIATEYALIFGEGYLMMLWDINAGNETGIKQYVDKDGVERAMFEKTGDIVATVHAPMDVIRDTTQYQSMTNDWYIIRQYVNKYEYAARFPEKGDEIESMTVKHIPQEHIWDYDKYSQDTDLVPLYTFMHKKSSVIPKGRFVQTIGDCVIVDSDLPYMDIPVYRISAGEMYGFNAGYSNEYDLLPLQSACRMFHSTIVTNNNATGIPSLVVDEGANVDIDELSSGLKVISKRKGYDIQPLQLTRTAPETYNAMQIFETLMQTISGVNAVSRGNPPPNVRAGSAMALIQSMAIQFNSVLQNSYVEYLEAVGTGIVDILKQYANKPMIAMIAGQNDLWQVKQFTADDLKHVQRVIVDVGNALTNTLAGRQSIADNLLQAGMIKNPDQYIMVLKTGNLNVLTNDETNEQMTIRRENELMLEGQQISALLTDNHVSHVLGHRQVVSSPENRDNPQLIMNVLNHIQEHINMSGNPDNAQIIMAMGFQPMVNPQAMAPQGDEMMQPEIPGLEKEAPGMPSMPKNPLSGQEWNPQTGGL